MTATTLRAAGAALGLYMGSQFKHDNVMNTSTSYSAIYKQTHTKEYGLSTVGNDCKWQSTHRQSADVYTLDECIESFQYSQDAGQAFRGHNLCWGNDNPEWLTCGAANLEPSLCNYTSDELSGFLVDHINTVMPGVRAGVDGAAIYAWDVVNEAVDYHDNAWGLKTNTWYPAVHDYVDLAFTTARAADPDALLCYNDYDSDGLNGKSTAIYDMVADMVDRQIPIDCVGLQMHITVDDPPSRADVSDNMARLGKLGLVVHVTELDVVCEQCYDQDGNANSTALELEADVYGDMLGACLDNLGVW